VFARRLREARQRAQLTQEDMAAKAGFDEFSASARISQYETGKHVPRYEIAQQLAKVLRVPVEYFYAADDRIAELLLLWSALPKIKQEHLLDELRKMV
jgi:transcriptional regulator with XRE-family HTH domain